MEEFFHISHSLTDTDRDGCIILCYELMIEAEHRFRIKWGGGVGHHHPLPSSGNAPPCPRDKLEDIAWNKPGSKTLECLVWSVYDGILSPGPTPKLTGPESYNQVTRRLTSKVLQGVASALSNAYISPIWWANPGQSVLSRLCYTPKRDAEKARGHWGHRQDSP